MLKRRQREWAAQDKEYEAQLELAKKNEKRVEELKARAAKEMALRAAEAKRLTDAINAVEEKKAEARAGAEVKVREMNAGLLRQLESESEAAAEEKKAGAVEKAKGE